MAAIKTLWELKTNDESGGGKVCHCRFFRFSQRGGSVDRKNEAMAEQLVKSFLCILSKAFLAEEDKKFPLVNWGKFRKNV